MSDEKVLKSSPGMLPLFARAGASMIPGSGRLPFVATRGRSGEVPELTLVLEDVTVDRDRLAAYDRVCRFPLRDALPATYPHMLAFPLQLSLMTDPGFPFPPLGLVHISNVIEQRRPIDAAEELGLRVWATPLEAHPRGTQVTMCSEARVGEELVWDERSTYLKRGGSKDGGADREPRTEEELPVTATWRLPGDLGRRYGSVSGDLNPIHMHSLSARLFGFPTAIAHGMWTKARCLAALDPRLPDRFTVEVAFRKPILLPATVQFSEREDDAGIAFGVRGAGKGTPHLDGQISFG
ncbi:MAG TPA: MaoC/PaaZ C-terminal domain-containing protein [Solirubrobacteraceae bacterium]|nr:MaoC/PaaZ C-terminal domain-containing protein [Solirubrobacteraceae bacterium]